MSDAYQWTCDIEKPTEPITVGAKFKLNCGGSSQPTLNSPVHIQFEKPEQENTLVILDTVRSESTGGQFVVTGYKPGQYKTENMKLTDGKTAISISPQTWEVISILPKDQQPLPQPFPSYGPFILSLPLWLWLAIAIMVVALVYTAFRYFKKKRDLTKLKENLQQHISSLGAYGQFNKDIRSLTRQVAVGLKQKVAKEYIEELNKMVRYYFVREFWIPAQEWTSRQTLTELKKAHAKIYQEFKIPLTEMLRELDRAVQSDRDVNGEDFEQLVNMSRGLIDRIYSRKAGKKK